METLWLLYSAALVVVAALLVKALSSRHCRRLNLPPGPKPWPIIGNLNLMGSLPHHSMHKLSKKHGPLMKLRFGSVPVIVISSPEMAKQLFKVNDLSFAFRPNSAAGKYLFYDYTDIIFSPYGPYSRQARKVCFTQLFSPKCLRSFEYIRHEEVKSLVCDLYAGAGKSVVVKDYVSKTNLNIIFRMVLGKTYFGGAEVGSVTPEELRKGVEEMFILTGVLNIGDYIPWLGFLDIQGYVQRMKAVSKTLDSFLEQVLSERDARRVGTRDFVAKDMVDVLLQHADDPNLQVKFTRSHIKGFILDMIGGGIDTSTATLEWAISELLKQPETIKKAVEELDRVIGKDRWVEEKDIPNLPYIDAIVKETMRLHPVAPLMSPHFSKVECTIAGYDIPAGTIALVNAWALGRDARAWDMPGVFRPERFVGKEIDVKGQDYELLPFGSGRRMCPGYSLGLKLVQLSLSNLIHGFVWKLPENFSAEKLDMEERFGLITSRKVPITVFMEPRLSDHLYRL